MNKHELVALAFEAREHSYSPYSGFRVGAAVLTAKGGVYQGSNVENASYGATICAERSAALKAVYDGERKLTAIAVVGMPDNVSAEDAAYAFPCGLCLQFLHEFAAQDMKIYVARTPNDIIETSLGQMMPYHFGSQQLSE